MFPLISGRSLHKQQIKKGTPKNVSSFENLLTSRSRSSPKSNSKPTVKELNLQSSINFRTRKKLQISRQKRPESHSKTQSVEKMQPLQQINQQSNEMKLGQLSQIKDRKRIEGVIALIRRKITNEVRNSFSKNQQKSAETLKIIKQQPFYESLWKIEQQMLKSDEKSNLFQHSFWGNLLKSIKKYHMAHNQKLQVIDLLIAMIKVNFGQDQVQNQLQFCAQYGQKFNKLQQNLFMKHKNAFEILQFLANKNNHCHLGHQCLFTSLKFDLSETETLNLAAHVRSLFQHNIEAFALMTLYFHQSVINQLGKHSLKTIKNEYLTRLRLLTQKYPKNQHAISKTQRSPEIMAFDSYHRPERLFFEANQKHPQDQLKELIIKKVDHSIKDKDAFEELVKSICCKKGYGFQTELKVKNRQNSFAIDDIAIQVLLNQQKFKLQNDNRHQNNFNLLQQSQVCDYEALKQLIDAQIKQTESNAKKFLEIESSIAWQVNDLIKAKCTFLLVNDLIQTTNELIYHILSSRRQVIQLNDRLNSSTRDILLTVKLTNSIAELTLQLKDRSVSDLFYHRILDLIEFKYHSPLTNLFVQNSKSSSSLFTDLFELNLSLTSNDEECNFHFDTIHTFKSFSMDVQHFCKKFLQPYQTKIYKDAKTKHLEKMQLDQKISLLIRIIKKYHNIERSNKKKPIEQYHNEMLFWKSYQNYDKVFEIFELIPTEQLQKSRQLLELKADIYFVTKKYNKSAETFQLWIQLNQLQLLPPSLLLKIAKSLKQATHYEDALKYLYLALKQDNKNIQCKDSSTAQIIKILALTYLSLKDYDNAYQCFEKALRITINSFGNISLQVSAIYQSLAILHKEQENHDKAILSFKSSLEIRQKMMGREYTAQILIEIGKVYLEKEEYEKSIENFSESYNIQLQTDGLHSIKVSKTLRNLGIAYKKKGHNKQGFQHMRRSLDIKIGVLGAESVEVGLAMLELSLFHSDCNQLQESLKYAMGANKLFYQQFGEQHDYTQNASKQANKMMTKLAKSNSQAADYMKVDV